MTNVSCCSFSRRELLRWAAIVGSTSLLPVVDPDHAYAAATRSARKPTPHNAEVVTLTETGAVITWYTGVPGKTGDSLQPSPQDTELLIGTSPARLRTVLHDSIRTPYHYAEVHGLEPGRTYYYQARSGGVPAAPSTSTPGNPLGAATTTLSGLRGYPDVLAFSTPQPPAGKHLFTIALANDLHLGETLAGVVTTIAGKPFPPGVSQVAGEPPYTEVMATAMVADAVKRGAHTMLVAGDLSSEGQPADLRRAMGYLERFGRYGTDVFVARGNHDRAHAGAAYDSCSVSSVDPTTRDCFRDIVDHGAATWFATQRHGLRIIGLDTYDKAGNGGDNGALSPEQMAWFTTTLAEEPDRPTFVLGHHPLTLRSDVVNAEPAVYDLDPAQSRQIQTAYAGTPGVFFQHSAHTHRNFRTSSATARGVVFQEVGATKEYPGGFSLLRVHEGGYAMNFYKTRGELALEWSERTRGEYGGVGFGAFYQAGSIADRNLVVHRDLSGLAPAPAGRSGSRAVELAAGAAALAVGGVAAAAHTRSHHDHHLDPLEAAQA